MIEIQSVTKSFDGVPAIEDVSLEIRDGETFCIIGRSGSGKSVLLRHLLKLVEPDEGRILIDGAPLDELKYDELRFIRRKFGVLFQQGALFDSLTAIENVAFPLATFSELSEDEVRARAEECLQLVELPGQGHKLPSELSGGQQKRVGLARAIAVEPEYLLYDEPTSGLDPETGKTIDELIVRLGTEIGCTSIVISHDIHSVLRIADRVAFLHHGRLHWSGSIGDLHSATDPLLSDFIRASEYRIGESEPISP